MTTKQKPKTATGPVIERSWEETGQGYDGKPLMDGR
jgi:hypothetical protein